LELEKNAEAIFQVADELYMNRRYHLDPGTKARSKAITRNTP